MTLLTARHFPRHSHDDYGFGLLTLGGHRSWSGRGLVEAFAGDMIAVNPGEIHDGQPMRGEPRGWRMIYLRPSILARIADEAEAGRFEFARPSFRDEPAARMFVRLFSALTAEPADRLAVEERLALLLDRLLAEHGARPQRPQTTPAPIAKALQRLDDEPAASVTLAEIASLAGMSRFQVLRAFSRHLGMTPHAYLVQRRVRLARVLLRAGGTPVEAAVEAGFSDQSHMTRAFSRCYGVTPARFRAAIAAA
jgi:AraC-like DNA-binding protein